MDYVFTLEVYSNAQWSQVRKKNYIVRGRLEHLRAYVLRWMERDHALDPTHIVEFHNFYLDEDEIREAPPELATQLDAFMQLIWPWMFETCPHGMSAWLCEDPISHYPRDI